MSEFERRKQGFERFFALSEALRFQAQSRRNRAIGVLAADKLGLRSEAAERYVEAFAKAQIDGASDEALVERLHGEFTRAGLDLSAHRIRRRFEAAMADAIAAIEGGGDAPQGRR